MNPLRFDRASRDNCLRAADPVQGPYRKRFDITQAGHRFAVRFCVVGLAVVLFAVAKGWI